MRKALDQLKSQIATFKDIGALSDSAWQKISQKVTVLLMAGGEGARFTAVAQGQEVNKNSFVLPNNDTMIEMCIRLYKKSGITNFVALLYHKAESIENLLGDGTKYGVNIKYSYDPGKPVGKGGAVKHAFENNLIPNDHYIVVHNPDDVILDYPGDFPREVISGHLAGEKSGALASVVVVEETPHQFSAMKVSNSFVDQIEMYPMIPLPTHIGITVFSPNIQQMFIELFNYKKKKILKRNYFPSCQKRENCTP